MVNEYPPKKAEDFRLAAADEYIESRLFQLQTEHPHLAAEAEMNAEGRRRLRMQTWQQRGLRRRWGDPHVGMVRYGGPQWFGPSREHFSGLL